MNIEKRNGEWRIVLEAQCPACGNKVKALKPKHRRLRRGRKCKKCGYYVDAVYFD